MRSYSIDCNILEVAGVQCQTLAAGQGDKRRLLFNLLTYFSFLKMAWDFHHTLNFYFKLSFIKEFNSITKLLIKMFVDFIHEDSLGFTLKTLVFISIHKILFILLSKR